MSTTTKFENGISDYIKASAKVDVYFPIDLKGNAHISCSQCYFFNIGTSRCRLNGEVCQFPNNYVGGSCPLTFEEDET